MIVVPYQAICVSRQCNSNHQRLGTYILYPLPPAGILHRVSQLLRYLSMDQVECTEGPTFGSNTPKEALALRKLLVS